MSVRAMCVVRSVRCKVFSLSSAAAAKGPEGSACSRVFAPLHTDMSQNRRDKRDAKRLGEISHAKSAMIDCPQTRAR